MRVTWHPKVSANFSSQEWCKRLWEYVAIIFYDS